MKSFKGKRPLPSPAARPRTYRDETAKFQTFAGAVSFLWKWSAAMLLVTLLCTAAASAQQPVRIVALGDSLTAGFGIAAAEAFPAKLEHALKASHPGIEIVNAGVSGDTASAGLARLDWSAPDGVHGVIVELGANDALRGIDPAVTRGAIEQILQRLKARNVPVLLCGMRAPPNMGADYAARFDAIFPELAAQYGVLLYPFFLEGVAAQRSLNLQDGIHPTAQGVDVIVRNILPKVEELIARIGKS
jgi:acyl-CoA thioesterase-1